MRDGEPFSATAFIYLFPAAYDLYAILIAVARSWAITHESHEASPIATARIISVWR